MNWCLCCFFWSHTYSDYLMHFNQLSEAHYWDRPPINTHTHTDEERWCYCYQSGEKLPKEQKGTFVFSSRQETWVRHHHLEHSLSGLHTQQTLIKLSGFELHPINIPWECASDTLGGWRMSLGFSFSSFKREIPLKWILFHLCFALALRGKRGRYYLREML